MAVAREPPGDVRPSGRPHRLPRCGRLGIAPTQRHLAGGRARTSAMHDHDAPPGDVRPSGRPHRLPRCGRLGIAPTQRHLAGGRARTSAMHDHDAPPGDVRPSGRPHRLPRCGRLGIAPTQRHLAGGRARTSAMHDHDAPPGDVRPSGRPHRLPRCGRLGIAPTQRHLAGGGAREHRRCTITTHRRVMSPPPGDHTACRAANSPHTKVGGLGGGPRAAMKNRGVGCHARFEAQSEGPSRPADPQRSNANSLAGAFLLSFQATSHLSAVSYFFWPVSSSKAATRVRWRKS